MLTDCQEHVRLHAQLIRWRVAWDADSLGYDTDTEQLQFHVPGRGRHRRSPSC
jgi:hypothetical protein